MTSVEIKLAALLLLLPVPTVIADTLFEESIPLDVAEALFGYTSRGSFTVYSDIASRFPEFELPPSFEVLGSNVNDPMIRVGLGTSLEAETALDSIVSAFTNREYVAMPIIDTPSRGGFIFPNQIATQNRQLCHDEEGQLTVSFREREPLNFVILSTTSRGLRNWRSCEQLIEEQQRTIGQMMGRRGMVQYMPRLVLPDEGDQGISPSWVLFGGVSSSSNSADSEATIEIDWELEEVYQHFATQLSEQGWLLDSESIGNVSGQGIWTHSPEPNLDLIGHFNVVDSGDSEYELTIRIELPGGRGSGFQPFRVN